MSGMSATPRHRRSRGNGPNPDDRCPGRTGRHTPCRPGACRRAARGAPAPGTGRAGHRLGQVGCLLGGYGSTARAGQRADPGRLTAAGADARPDRGGGRTGWLARRHHQLHQRGRLVERAGRAAQRPAGHSLPISPERLANPRFAAELPELLGGCGLLVIDEGPLCLGLGLRLPARLPAAYPHPAATRAGHARAGYDRYGQPAGHRGRGGPARVGDCHVAALARPGVSPARRGARPQHARGVRLGDGGAAHAADEPKWSDLPVRIVPPRQT